MAFMLIFAFILLLFFYMLLEPYWIQVKKYSFAGAGQKIRVVFLSDIHYGHLFSIRRVGKIVKMANALEPDIVLLGGDYILFGKEYIRPFFGEMRGLKKTAFTGGVLGNHDHWAGKVMSLDAMRDAGITCLDNAAFSLKIKGRKIAVGGVGDCWEDKQDIRPLLGKSAGCDYSILVTHNPDYFMDIPPEGLGRVNLVLAGHTHGGQVSFFGLWAPVVVSRYGQRFRTGMKTRNGTKMLVSNGLGTNTLPIRCWARPQILVVDI